MSQAKKYVRKSGKKLELYEDKHCVECDQTHALKTNEVHVSSKAIDSKVEKYKTLGYEEITSFEMLDRVTLECSGPDDDED